MAKVRDKTEVRRCLEPDCGEVLTYDPKDRFWRCPACGGEWWKDREPDQANLPPILVDKMVRDVYHEEIRTGSVPGTKKKGGSKSKRKKPKKTPEWTRRYAEV